MSLAPASLRCCGRQRWAGGHNRAKIGPWEEFRMLSPEMASRSQARPSTKIKSLSASLGLSAQNADQRPSTLTGWLWTRKQHTRQVDQRNLDNDAQSGAYTKLVEVTANGSGVVTNAGRQAFNEAFKACPVVRYRRNGAVMAVYQRLISSSQPRRLWPLCGDLAQRLQSINRDFSSSTGTEIS